MFKKLLLISAFVLCCGNAKVFAPGFLEEEQQWRQEARAKYTQTQVCQELKERGRKPLRGLWTAEDIRDKEVVEKYPWWQGLKPIKSKRSRSLGKVHTFDDLEREKKEKWKVDEGLDFMVGQVGLLRMWMCEIPREAFEDLRTVPIELTAEVHDLLSRYDKKYRQNWAKFVQEKKQEGEAYNADRANRAEWELGPVKKSLTAWCGALGYKPLRLTEPIKAVLSRYQLDLELIHHRRLDKLKEIPKPPCEVCEVFLLKQLVAIARILSVRKKRTDTLVKRNIAEHRQKVATGLTERGMLGDPEIKGHHERLLKEVWADRKREDARWVEAVQRACCECLELVQAKLFEFTPIIQLLGLSETELVAIFRAELFSEEDRGDAYTSDVAKDELRRLECDAAGARPNPYPKWRLLVPNETIEAERADLLSKYRAEVAQILDEQSLPDKGMQSINEYPVPYAVAAVAVSTLVVTCWPMISAAIAKGASVVKGLVVGDSTSKVVGATVQTQAHSSPFLAQGLLNGT
jgi:hypothetical protein